MNASDSNNKSDVANSALAHAGGAEGEEEEKKEEEKEKEKEEEKEKEKEEEKEKEKEEEKEKEKEEEEEKEKEEEEEKEEDESNRFNLSPCPVGMKVGKGSGGRPKGNGEATEENSSCSS
ncbi:hypothetical protein J3Q64DRAFT_1828545 [Phycomyces blakesleeanus]|uniref:Uncharacterized protein n=1 Tax=Phycomyces blakesleeanus TaxID=4837 RepID=A0ABR3BGM0_PHYBL